jgi:hypothetical protein
MMQKLVYPPFGAVLAAFAMIEPDMGVDSRLNRASQYAGSEGR